MTSSSSLSQTPQSSAGPQQPETARDRGWVLRVWVLVAVFAAVTAYWSHHVGVPLRDPGGKMFSGRLTSALVLLAILALVEVCVRTIRSNRSWRGAIATFSERWTLERVALVLTGLLAYHIVYVCYRNLKSWDAFNTVRDDALNDFERWLFFGNTPASLLHDVLGQDSAAYVLMVVYKSFTYLVPLSVVSALVFNKKIRDGYVFLVAAMWVWILGVGSYYLIPSLGPFASAPADFTGLPNTAITSTQVKYLSERAHLLENPGAPDAFASISAFASLHVAFTCLIFFMLRYYGLRALSLVLGVYLAGTMLATVYFGWHFVVDIPAGVLIAYLAVLLGRMMIYPSWPPSTAPPRLESRPAQGT